ncbi:MAG: radical SAM protein [Actinobacteria bacterium]|nr:radical SAM protein [Actinomycetota bacterium]
MSNTPEETAEGSVTCIEADKFKAPPLLIGYTYDPKDAYGARNEGRLLSIRLETNHYCNLNCRYCYAKSGTDRSKQADYEVLADLVRQAGRLGARSIVVIGGGEPTIYPGFMDLISLIHSLEMVPVVFSNTVAIDKDLAEFLFESGASVMGKLDSLSPKVQDYMAGKNGASEKIGRGLQNLIDAGFTDVDDPGRLRLGVSCVTNRLNLEEIEEIWRFCRENNIFPNLEVLTPTGRAKEHLENNYITFEEIKNYKLELLEIDRNDYSFDWLPYTPLPGSGCLQQMYSMYITVEGNVRPCAPTKFDENPSLFQGGAYPHNIFKRPLARIYNDPLFHEVRNIETSLEGKCHDCRHLDECVGCRGYAYSVGVSEGKGPVEALRGECLQCFRADGE